MAGRYDPTMPYLVEVLGVFAEAREAADALEEAFVQIASELRGVAGADDAEGGALFHRLRNWLAQQAIGISSWSHQGGKLRVHGGDWDRREVETNLRQIEIIIFALRGQTLASSTNVVVNPTQQAGLDAHGTQNGALWALEAYGGVNVKNNGKLVEDAKSLSAVGAGIRKLFACRPSAWPWRAPNKKLREGIFTQVNDPEVEEVRLFEFTPAAPQV